MRKQPRLHFFRSFPRLALTAGLVLPLTGCQPENSAESSPASTEDEVAEAADAIPWEEEVSVRVFEVTGVLQQIKNNGYQAVIDHREIPNFMRAMIMHFQVEDREELRGLQAGDEIRFKYHVSPDRSWITHIEATGEKGEVKNVLADLDKAAKLGVGDELPDYEFLDSEAEDFMLSDVRGMPVALTFVFTACPVPEYCPAMMKNFNAVNQKLATDPDAPEDWRLLTVSFDSWNDTPEVMKAWGSNFGHEPGGKWKLLTSDSCCTINALAKSVGLKFGEVEGTYQHNLRTLVLDPEGRITKVFLDETWTEADLVESIKAAAGSSAVASSE